jgi:hypothetical protein
MATYTEEGGRMSFTGQSACLESERRQVGWMRNPDNNNNVALTGCCGSLSSLEASE